jgi:hypothetical protein
VPTHPNQAALNHAVGFTRSLTPPDAVSGDGIAAEYRDGVLYLALPKKEEVKARRIEIAGEGLNQKAMGAGAGQ